MDPLSGGASIRALILFQMALCANGQHLYHSTLMLLPQVFTAHSAAHAVLDTYSRLTLFIKKKKKKIESIGTCCLTKRAADGKHTGTDLRAASVSVCCRGEEEYATLSGLCLQLRLCALLYNLTFADTS